MMTNEDFLRIAKIQSAIDFGCAPEDFDKNENIVTISAAHPKARKYLSMLKGN